MSASPELPDPPTTSSSAIDPSLVGVGESHQSNPRPNKRTLSELQDEAEENEVKDVEGDASDDQPEDNAMNGGEGEGSPNGGAGADGNGEEEEEEEEDEEEDGADSDRPRKKKRRRRVGNQFLDIEADVDEDEDEEEDEGEEGFIANDNFIVDRREARQERDGSLPAGEVEEDADVGDLDGDASHRRLDRRRMAKKDQEAAALAEELDARYKKNKYKAGDTDDWAPQALLMPSVNDPSIWGVKCKVGRERDLVLSLSRKAAAYEASDNAAPLRIISAFQRDSLKGYLYVEARSEQDVRNAVHGLVGMYHNGPNGIFLVDLEEMPDLLKTKQKKIELSAGGWVRIKRGTYAGDLAQVMALSENGEEALVKFIPRIDLTPKDDNTSVGPDGKKRRKAAATPLAFRPPQRLFNPEAIQKAYGTNSVSKRAGVYIFKNDDYKDGFCEKDIRLTALTIEDVTPTIDELTRFQGENGANGEPLDLASIAEMARKVARTILQPGDHVEVFEGDQKGIHGTVDSIANEIVTLTPDEEHDLGSIKVEVPTKSVRKRFRPGDHVKVMQGSNADETGLVVKVENDTVTFLSDLSSTEVSVFAKDVREAAEIGSGVNVIGGYELHDLVQLDPQTAGVIIKIEREMFRILDQTGIVRSLKPSQISSKVSTKFAVATDAEGFDIKAGETMKETNPNNPNEERRGRVLHVYRSLYAFLHSRDIVENGGVFVAYARNLQSTAPRANKPKQQLGMGMNPERAGMMMQPPQQAQTGPSFRPDGRIHRKVFIIQGTYKGNTGIIKDVTGGTARVELHSVAKVITIALEKLKEQKPDGSLVPLLERPGGGPGYGGRGGPPGGGGGFSRESSTFSSASNAAPLGGPQHGGYGAMAPPPFAGGRTPAPNFANGRTPAPNYNGGRTPAPGMFGGGVTPFGAGGAGGAGGGAFDPSGRTPNPWSADSRTPFHRPDDAFNPSSRTPFHPGIASGQTPNPYNAPPPPGVAAAQSAFNSSSRTPYGGGNRTPYGGGGRGGGATNDGGKTPDPRRAAGGRTPAYGAKNGYTGAPTPAAMSAPTPAANGGNSGWEEDEWGAGPSSAPTPSAARANEYQSAATPYTAPTPYSAPTPGGQGAPTPAPYPPGPTPAASAQTPGAGLSYQTPGVYAGAATTAAEPLEYHERSQNQNALPKDWVVQGVRVIVEESTFQSNRLIGQYAIIKESNTRTCTMFIESNAETVEDFPCSDLKPMGPYDQGERCLVLAGPHRGERVVTKSADGDEFMVDLANGGGSVVVETRHLVQLGQVPPKAS
ncbi:uncharacterized protein JCM6883_001723 [Sporobolomyces salmoneus]|uniref:uncharacterized protein n=1 Tax=Sporobolomyces salmoneus TaxID=183962 RepID=UPI0031739883